MAISIYDMNEGKWYIECANGDLVPCENESIAKEISELTDEQIAQYRHQMVELGLMPRLQFIYEKD